MKRKIRIELIDSDEEEIIIRTKNISEDIVRLQKFAETLSDPGSKELELHMGNTDYLVSTGDLLFFETENDHVIAHTADHLYTTDRKLYELMDFLPHSFVRASKATIINVKAVQSVKKDLTGSCQVFFKNSEKFTFVSRMYYKPFREALKERTFL